MITAERALRLMDIDLPDGKHKGWEIMHRDVTPEDLRREIESYERTPGMAVDRQGALAHKAVPETNVPYLLHNGQYCMSANLTMKLRHVAFLQKARGDVLLTGLGLGMVAAACKRHPNVTSVTVVEIDKHLINFIRPHIPVNRAPYAQAAAIFERADAYTWSPRFGKTYDCIYHDIWSSLELTSTWVGQQRLMERYAQWLRPEGVHSCFERDSLAAFVAQLKESGKINIEHYPEFYEEGEINLATLDRAMAKWITAPSLVFTTASKPGTVQP